MCVDAEEEDEEEDKVSQVAAESKRSEKMMLVLQESHLCTVSAGPGSSHLSAPDGL